MNKEELKKVDSLIAENSFLKKEVKQREQMIERLKDSAKEDGKIYQKKIDELTDDLIMYQNLTQ